MFNRLRNKLQSLLESPVGDGAKSLSSPGSRAPAPREPAPVVVYFERERGQHLLERMIELLTSRDIQHRTLDVRGDAATLAFITREAKCKDDDLPIVFVAGTAVGGYDELVDWDSSGRLREAVFGK